MLIVDLSHPVLRLLVIDEEITNTFCFESELFYFGGLSQLSAPTPMYTELCVPFCPITILRMLSKVAVH